MGALDQYFTPRIAADRLVQLIAFFDPSRVIDSSCGDGGLLGAVERLHPRAQIYGIDVDREIVSRLATAQPSWCLRHGDALDEATWSGLEGAGIDAAVLNPPFSVQGRRSLQVSFGDATFSASVAMSHLLSVVKNTRPKALAAILPESTASSELDRRARLAIGRSYEVHISERLPVGTFQGVAGSAFSVRLTRRATSVAALESSPSSNRLPVEVIRGGLPVFQATATHKGLPYIHTVSIRTLLADGVMRVPRVTPISRGRVSGNVVLIPRVGLPQTPLVQAVALQHEVQLSDCVVALRCETAQHAAQVSNYMKREWSSFSDLYRGTGARFVTLERLVGWLQQHRLGLTARLQP